MSQPNSPVERYPAHEPGMQKMPMPAAHLPNPLVRLVPIFCQPCKAALNLFPATVSNSVPVFGMQIHSIHELPENVELQLIPSSVANTDGFRIPISAEMR